jgi:perosamine synthetase
VLAYLLPYNQSRISSKNFKHLGKHTYKVNDLFPEKDFLFFESAKRAIHYIITELALSREDEVFISTTSGSPFVTTCVSATIFNYCKISRVITDKTKLIWVIHEFGFPNKSLDKLLDFSIKNNIPVVEDSAHSLNGYFDGKKLGTMGDYGLFSLPKSVPMKSGGLLIGNKLSRKNNNYEQRLGDQIQKEFIEKYINFLELYGKIRNNIYLYYQDKFVEHAQIFAIDNAIEPFVYGFIHNKSDFIYSKYDGKKFEMARSYNKDWILLPINPFLTTKKLQELINSIKKYV